jgi:hypothetical protein
MRKGNRYRENAQHRLSVLIHKTQHSRCIWILDLHPILATARHIFAIASLRDNALKAERASMVAAFGSTSIHTHKAGEERI